MAFLFSALMALAVDPPPPIKHEPAADSLPLPGETLKATKELSIMPLTLPADTNDLSFYIQVLWDPSRISGVSNYAVYFGTISHIYTNHFDVGTNLTSLIQLPDYTATYYLSIGAQLTNGQFLGFSPELVIPQPITNLVRLSITIQRSGSVSGTYSNWLHITFFAKPNPVMDDYFYRAQIEGVQSTIPSLFKLNGAAITNAP